MLRATTLAAVLLGCAVGCSKKTDATNPEGGGDPATTYTLTFREAQKGDKHEIVRTRNATATTKTKNSIQTKKEEYRYEFTETIEDTSPDERLPTKVTRVYKTAERTDPKGDTKSASYVGKTITIEKYQQGYKFAADGQPLPPFEEAEISQDFHRGRWKLDQTFPKKAVKVGEEWKVDFAALAGKAHDVYDKEKSTITGKLVRAYKKDGRQWGVIEKKIDVVTAGAPVNGATDSDETYDIVIDGSAQAGTLKITMKGSVEAKDMFGNQVITTVEGTGEESLTPVK